MHRSFLVAAIVLIVALVAIIFVAPVLSQGGGNSLPPAKLAALASATADQATREALPHAPKTGPTGQATVTCPSATLVPGVYDFGFGPFPRGNLFINVAGETLNGIHYSIYAGALANSPLSPGFVPPLYGNPAPVYTGPHENMSQQGLLRVIANPMDPCAAMQSGQDASIQDYLYPKGPLSITQIVGTNVIFSTPGGGTGQFNFITGQFSPPTP